MNKMHTLAKVLVTIIGIYWLVKAFGWLISSFTYIFASTQQGQLDIKNVLMILVSLVIQTVIILFLISVLYKRNKIAERIVGTEEISSPKSQLNWIGFAYRLISVIAGLYCFSVLIFFLGNFSRIFMFRRCPDNSQSIFNFEALQQGVSIIILLVAGVYLFCGAPHFVKWQTKKTIEMCARNS